MRYDVSGRPQPALVAASGRVLLALPKLVTFALLGSLVYTAVAVVIPLIQRDIVNNAILTHRQPIWIGATALIIAALIGFGGVFTRRYLGGRMSLDVQHDLRTEMFASLSRLDGARQDQLHTGQVVSRSISDVNMIQGLLAMVPFLIGNILLFFLSLDSDGLPFAAAHHRRHRGRSRPLPDLTRLAEQALPRQLGRAAARRQRRWRGGRLPSPGSASSRASGRRNRRSSGSNGPAACSTPPASARSG